MKELEPRDVDLLRLGLRQVRKLVASAGEAAPGLPGHQDLAADIRRRLDELDAALVEPLNQLVTPPAKKTPPPPGGVR